MMTIKEFAEFMKVSVVTVRSWLKKGMPCIRIGNIIRIAKEDALSWVSVQKRGIA